MNGDIVTCLFCGFALKLFFTKPIENLWKSFETLVVDGQVEGYKISELVQKFNQEVSEHKENPNYSSVFGQGTGLESFFGHILDGDHS